jgi:hypothetical protein
VVGGAVDEDEFDAGGVEGVGDRLVLGRGLGDRGDDGERRPVGGEAVDLAGERLDGHREAAVAQFGEEGRHVLAQLEVDHLRLFLAQSAGHGEGRGR